MFLEVETVIGPGDYVRRVLRRCRVAQVDAEKSVPSIRALQEMRSQAVSLQLSNEAAVGILGK